MYQNYGSLIIVTVDLITVTFLEGKTQQQQKIPPKAQDVKK